MGDWEWLERAFAGLNVLVIGDVMLDSYVLGASRRLCQEAPVPVVDVSQKLQMPGGAGNVAANAAALGAGAALLGVVGEDDDGDELTALLVRAGVSARTLQRTSRRTTLSKRRIICDQQLLARCDLGSTGPLDPSQEARLLSDLARLYPRADVVLAADYGYGVFSDAVIAQIACLQNRWRKVLAVDSKRLSAYRSAGVTVCKPNYRETLNLLHLPDDGSSTGRCQRLAELGPRVLDRTGAQIAAVSLDREGALFFQHGQPPYRTFAQGAPQQSTAGAGDTFLCALAMAVAAGADTPQAAELASAAAAVVVSRRYTSVCSWADLRSPFIAAAGSLDLSRLTSFVEQHRREHRQIVLTNGCFDILHRGHIAYLEQARRLGDVLIVGVNTDESIRRLKGPSRPINTLADRIDVLRGLSSVDCVVPMAEDTPHELIRAVRPQVFVKGGDYTRATLPEADLVEELGGTVKILPFVSERSTSRIISRICQTHASALERENDAVACATTAPCLEGGA